jgi:light-regulated signal transduction histidine kinase (bacteriophytochrome)
MLYKTVQNQEAALRNAARDLERRVEERTASLAEAVGELEAFTYTVSHDLRAPIRAIMGFASLLEEDLGRPVPPEVARQTAMIKDSAARMGRLVDDLLAFSRAGRRPLAVQPVEPGQLVASVLGEAEPEMAGRDIEVRIGDLPPCQADPGLLRQVYHNLISNALKYTRKRDHPVIEIGHGRSDNEWAYFVRDNGMGLDMRYAGRIFGVFQRLHTDEEFEGTGVGLAHVQRIVTRHGGRVWVESEPDRGATFWFTISR